MLSVEHVTPSPCILFQQTCADMQIVMPPPLRRKGWQMCAGWSRVTGSFKCMHYPSASLLYSVTLVSFLSSHVVFFILDLLSWRWWWVSLYNMKLRVRDTKQKWDRFSTLHRSGGSLPILVHCAVHWSWTWTLFCAFVWALFVRTSCQSARFHPLTLSSLHHTNTILLLYY